jgi:ankyrin repeat protein
VYQARGDEAIALLQHEPWIARRDLVLESSPTQLVQSRVSTPLVLAAALGQAGVVSSLLQLGADPNDRDGDGITPLVAAVIAGDLESVEHLLAAGVDTQARPKMWPNVLHLSILHGGGSEIVKRLISAGCDVNDDGRDGVSTLELAVISGDVRVVELVLTAGFDVQRQYRDGIGPSHRAAAMNSVDTLMALNEFIDI